MKTTDSVGDMESIRKALGQKQINYYGFSYGTYLGQVYATLHPDRVRRLVLDGNVDPPSSGTRRTSTRTSPSTATSGSTSTGSPSTTTSTTSATTVRG